MNATLALFSARLARAVAVAIAFLFTGSAAAASVQDEAVRYDGESALCTASGVGATEAEARASARRSAISAAASTRSSRVRYVSFLRITNDEETSGMEAVVSAEASFTGALWEDEVVEPATGGGISVRTTMRVDREQIRPDWRVEQLRESLTGEDLLRELRSFRVKVSSWNDPGAEDYVLGVLLDASRPRPAVDLVMQAIDLKQRLGEWNSAFNLANTYLDLVAPEERATLKRELERYESENEELLPMLDDLDEYMQLDGIAVVRLAELAEDRWLRASEYERVSVRTFDDARRIWIAVYRHIETGLEFSLVPADRNAGVLFPALVARTECTEQAFGRSKDSDGAGLAPQAGVSGIEAREWCERYGFDLPTREQWRYYCTAGPLSPRLPEGLNLGSKEARPVEAGLVSGHAFGLVDTLGNLAEWCLPDVAGASAGIGRWPLMGGSYKDDAASVDSEKPVDAAWKRRHYGFRPIRVLKK